MNDEFRRELVLNEEDLYLWWKRSKIGLYRFVKENRAEITKYIKVNYPDGENDSMLAIGGGRFG